MENNLLISFARTVLESIGYGLTVYCFLKLAQQFIQSANYRYWLNYAGLALVSGHFVISLISALTKVRSTFHVIDVIRQPVSATEWSPLVWFEEAEQFAGNYSQLIFAIYIAGLAIQIMRLAAGFLKISWIKNDKSLIQNDEWTKLVDTLTASAFTNKIAVYFSDKVSVPSTIGFFKPVILFPVAAINQLSLEQAEAILLHELAHIKRLDYLFNLLQTTVEAILFFNPAVWLISSNIRKEREFCCDDQVLRTVSKPIDYAKALLVVAENSQNNISLAVASSGNSRNILLNRIKRLMIMKTLHHSRRQKSIVLLLAVAITISLGFVIPDKILAQQSTEKQKARPAVPSTPPKPPVLPKPMQAPLPPVLPTPPQAPNPPGVADTAKKKFSVIVKDENGNEKVYNSIKELPAESRKEFLEEFAPTHFTDSLSKEQMAAIKANAEMLKKHFNSPEWKKQQESIRKFAEETAKKLNSPEWKKQQESVKIYAADLQKRFDSPEWKEQQEKMQKFLNSPEWKEQQGKMHDYLNSPGWKEQQKYMQKYTEEIRKRFNSPEWKAQQEKMKKYGEEMQKQFNSPEWQKQRQELEKSMEQFNKELEEFKKAKADSTKKN